MNTNATLVFWVYKMLIRILYRRGLPRNNCLVYDLFSTTGNSPFLLQILIDLCSYICIEPYYDFTPHVFFPCISSFADALFKFVLLKNNDYGVVFLVIFEQSKCTVLKMHLYQLKLSAFQLSNVLFTNIVK